LHYMHDGTLIEENQLVKLKENGFTQTPFLVCRAPFNSMTFSFNGVIKACCFTSDKLGIYPEKSLRELWLGETAQKARAMIRQNKLPEGCFYCLSNIQTEKYSCYRGQLFNYFSVAENQYPTRMEFQFSNTCNLECIMCSEEYSSRIAQKNNYKTTNPYKEKFLQELDEFLPYLEEALFVGGEPFLIPEYLYLWRRIPEVNKNCKIRIQTSGTILTAEHKEFLAKGKFNIHVSVDSLNKTMFEMIRKNASFEVFKDNLLWFIDYCRAAGTEMMALICIMQQNWQEVPQIIDFCIAHNIKTFFPFVYSPNICSLQSYSAQELQKVIAYYKNSIFPQQTEIARVNHIQFLSIIDQLQKWATAAV
jgi:sulfatase maturation enzyme AslB (radical SAM superfamily)